MPAPPPEMEFALEEHPGNQLHAGLRAQREHHSVTPARFLGLPAFVITGHDALRRAFADNDLFPGHRMYQASFEGAIGESFISMADPTRHRVYRKLATPAFRSRAIAAYENEGLAVLAHELADALTPRLDAGETVDLVSEFTARFPYLVISRLLGMPRDRENEFHNWALGLLRFRDDPARGAEAHRELTHYLAPIIAARRTEPRDDIISELVHAETDNRKLSDEEILSHIRLLFPTGGETTYGTLGNSIFALFAEDLWSEISKAPSLIPRAVDEALRWESSIAVLPRMSATDDIEFEGLPIPADTWVMFAIAAANRDPSVFENPDAFDLERRSGDMLTFGRGMKSCPGLHFAKRNMIVALEVLLERFPALELIDPDAALPRRAVLRAPEALRVRTAR